MTEHQPEAPAVPGVTREELAEALDGFWLFVSCAGQRVHGQVADPGEVASVLLATLGRIAAGKSPDEPASPSSLPSGPAVPDGAENDSPGSGTDDTGRDSARRHAQRQERPGPVPGEGSDGSDEERAEPHMNLLDTAWGVIANAGWDGMAKTPGWQEAAVRWRDDYHRWLDLHLRPGGYHTWEQLADSLVRERDALFSEVAGLRLERARAGSAALAAADLDLETPAASWRERAEAAEGKLAEIPFVIAAFFTHYGNSTAASLEKARDLAEAIRQVIDRDKSSSEEEGRGH